MDLLEGFGVFRRMLPDRARLFLCGGSGEPVGLARTLRTETALAEGLTFVAITVPGINRTDWAGLHPSCTAETIFLSQDWRMSFDAGRTRVLPLTYSQSWHWLGRTPLDGAVVMVSEPDRDGVVSLGISPDFGPAVLARGDVPALAVINPRMPAPPDSVRIPLTRFSLTCHDDTPLITMKPTDQPAALGAIAVQIGTLIRPGDTLQFGLGNLQQAVLQELAGRTGLRIHSGMISDTIQGLLDHDPDMPVTTGIAIGTPSFYLRLQTAENVRFRPVNETHMPDRLAQIPRFTAINSLIEIDLLGQANAEFINGRQISGTGGLTDFLRGARMSEGGQAITALASTASGGTISRIVPRLEAPAASLCRSDIDIVVTEHGIARLGNLDLDARAEALIGLAAPAFRADLSDRWAEMRRRL